MLELLGPPVACCTWGTGPGRWLTGQRPFDPEVFSCLKSAETSAFGSGGCGLPVTNRHFQHLVSLSLSLSETASWLFSVCACWLWVGRLECDDPPAYPACLGSAGAGQPLLVGWASSRAVSRAVPPVAVGLAPCPTQPWGGSPGTSLVEAGGDRTQV